ncbi:hypothetical protein Egran_03775 [Elaphomyces granulatus]|uniref:BRCT domain-containing protein n=1 Tax=Elaphomyces granulatus TaxID=519963 RepID=A0A232LWD4_9EURO|nr:hypothetical protein Egran_03775 [Elaphomyces granulatus]
MARLANIPLPSPKRRTRARTRGAKAVEELDTCLAKVTKVRGKGNAQLVKDIEKSCAESKEDPSPNVHESKTRIVPKAANCESDNIGDETEDEIGYGTVKSKKPPRSTRGKATNVTTKSTGRVSKKALMTRVRVENDEDDSDDDELAQLDAPKKKADRRRIKPIAKLNVTPKSDPIAKSTRGRPKGVKSFTSKEINARAEPGLDIPTETLDARSGPRTALSKAKPKLPTTEPVERKRVTFIDFSDTHKGNAPVPSATTKAKMGSVPSSSQAGLKAKPLRKTANVGRGRKAASADKNEHKPLSPKRATQVSKPSSSGNSDDADDDELSCAKTAIKLAITPIKPQHGSQGLISPVKRVNITGSNLLPNVIVCAEKENYGDTIPVVKPAVDITDSTPIASPPRRLPTSSKDEVTESPRRGALVIRDQPISCLDLSSTQTSPLKTSPKKCNLGPFTTSPFKAPSTPFKFKISLLQSPAKRVNSPFKEILNPVDTKSVAIENIEYSDTCRFQADDSTINTFKGSEFLSTRLDGRRHGVDEDVFMDDPSNTTSKPRSIKAQSQPLASVDDNPVSEGDFVIYEDQSPAELHEQDLVLCIDDDEIIASVNHSVTPQPLAATDTIRVTADMASAVSPYEVSEHGDDTSPLHYFMGIPPAAPSPPTTTAISPSVYAYRDYANGMDSEDELISCNSPSKKDPSPWGNYNSLESPMSYTEDDSVIPRKRPSTGNLGFTPLVTKLTQWKASSPGKVQGNIVRREVSSPALSTRPVIGPMSNGLEPYQLQVTRRSLTLRRSLLATSVYRHSWINGIDKTNDDNDSNSESQQSLAEDVLEPWEETAEAAHHQMQSDASNLIHDRGIGMTDDESEIYGDENATRPNKNIPLVEATPSKTKRSNNNRANEERIPLPMSITPTRVNRDTHRIVHTVSKVPLKCEGEISPLKVPRKRSRSISASLAVPSSRLCANPPTGHTSALKLCRDSTSADETDPPNDAETEDNRQSKPPSAATSPAKTARRNITADDQVLRGAVVFVDVHTTEGEDASGIFVELLTQMGARCVKTWAWNPRSSLSPVEGIDLKEGKVGITHVVYKDGGVRTLEKIRLAGNIVKCVGVGWVLDCERENKWVDESQYAVDSTIVPRGGAKRRKSMEPHALSNNKGSVASSTNGRRSGADWETMEEFMRLSTNTPSSSSLDPHHLNPTMGKHQPPRTPTKTRYDYNFDSLGMSPSTPYYLSQGAKLIQQTCPPKQTREGLFPISGKVEGEPDEKLRAKLEAARRKSLIFRPKVGSPLRK